MNFASLINFSRYSFPAKFHFHLKQYIYTMARLTPRITRAHDTLTISRPQSAKGDFKKRQGWGVGLMPLLGAAWLKNEVAFRHHLHLQTFFRFFSLKTVALSGLAWLHHNRFRPSCK
jgi:hypothetical protein